MLVVFAADTHYVSLSGTNNSPYLNWADAATQIQWAVDAATAGDTVLVSNGVYDTGGKVTPGYALTNRVVMTTAITLRSVNGPDYTSIKGAPAPAGGIGTGAVRCVYMSSGSLIGFTLTNGYAMSSGDSFYDRGPAGVLSYSSGSISNCVIKNNTAIRCGGAGLYAGSIDNCVITNNTSANYGGGIYLNNCSMNACVVVGNTCGQYGGGVCLPDSASIKNCKIVQNTGTSVDSGGGVWTWMGAPKLFNCTIANNRSSGASGGGVHVYGSGHVAYLTNCVVWGNISGGSASNIFIDVGSTIMCDHVCSGPVQAGTGNIGSDPQFVNTNSGNYRLRMSSPCVNAGTNQDWMINAVDLDGHNRILNNIVDMGTYETILWQGTIYRMGL